MYSGQPSNTAAGTGAAANPRALNQRMYSFAGMLQTSAILPSGGNAENMFSQGNAACSPQQHERRLWQPVLPTALRSPVTATPDTSVNPQVADSEILAKLFPETWGQKLLKLTPDESRDFAQHGPLRMGVVLSGGQAAGGHNVIAGIYDYIKQCNPQSQLIGFKNGPHGIFTHNYVEITDELMNRFRNLGGFDMICSGRHKIETEEQKRLSMDICRKLELHGLLIIGGDDSNTNGAILAEYFKANNCKTLVVGAPKTIDGDLKNEYIETSFGFDTAVKVYAECVGNLCADVATSRDRYHFVRLMGRSASNIALEVALQTRANLTFIGEEVQADNRSLKALVDEICDMVVERESMGKPFGVILLPEGLIEFIPEVGGLISQINDVLGDGGQQFDKMKLTAENRSIFDSLPEAVQAELLLERDSHGNVQVAKIATERLLILMVKTELARREFTGRFIPTDHYFGYEGRCAMPSNFDANYCYALGHTAGALVDNGCTGYMAVVRNLAAPVDEWVPAGCPVTIMMNIERRKGKEVPVIKKYLVELDQPMFQNFKNVRSEWKVKDLYRNPGPIQFDGPCSDITNFTIVTPTASYLLPSVPVSKCLVSKSLAVLSPLQVERLQYRPPVSPVLMNLRTRAIVAKKCDFQDQMSERFVRRFFPLQSDRHAMRAYAVEPCETGVQSTQPLRVGVVLCGQPVPGATNVIQGLYDRLSLSQGKLFGFRGITGLLQGQSMIVEKEDLAFFVNQGGFEMLGRTPSTKHEIRTDTGLASVARTCRNLELDGLVMIGGQTTLTDAAIITEYHLANGVDTRVVGVPANQENNVKHSLVEAAIGFDTTSKTYASLIGNLLTDAASATKYWYFVRLMGNVPSHIALEVALQTHANFTIISERYVQENMTVKDVVRDIADVVGARAERGKNFGLVMIPEGVVSSLPQMKTLLSEIDTLLRENAKNPEELEAIRKCVIDLDIKSPWFAKLSLWTGALLQSLPEFFRAQLVKQTPSGRLELSEVATEQLIAVWVDHELQERKKLGKYEGTFIPVCHYFGFQGRSALPSNFDCALAVAHGYLAAVLIESDLTGFLTSVRGLCARPQEWRFTGVPLSVLLKLMPDAETEAYGRKVPMVPCADVNLKGPAYNAFAASCESWETADFYCNPGPVQFKGTTACYCNRTLHEEQYEYLSMLEELDRLLGLVGGVCGFGVRRDTLKTAVISLQALAKILSDQS